jgi:hypothetical protein
VPFGPVALKGRPGTVNERYEVLAFVPENFKVVEAERIPCRVLNPPGFRLDRNGCKELVIVAPPCKNKVTEACAIMEYSECRGSGPCYSLALLYLRESREIWSLAYWPVLRRDRIDLDPVRIEPRRMTLYSSGVVHVDSLMANVS